MVAQFATADLTLLATKRASILILFLFLWGLIQSFTTFLTPFPMDKSVITGPPSAGGTMLKKLGLAKSCDAPHDHGLRGNVPASHGAWPPPTTRTQPITQCLRNHIPTMTILRTGGPLYSRTQIGLNFNSASVPQRLWRSIGERAIRLS